MRQPFTPLIDLLATRFVACRRALSHTEAMRFLLMALFSVLFVVGQTPTDGQGWFNQGLAQHRAGKFQDAAEAFQKALDLGFNPPGAMMRIGRAWAKQGNVDKALEWMEKSAAAGFSSPSVILADVDAASVRADARFAPVLERMQHNSAPCEYTAGFRAFDFWIGEWEVITAGGKSESVIEKIAGGCAILESWYGGGKSAGPGTAGKSLNLYNPATGRWRQFWTDDRGQATDYEGEIRDGAMHYTTSSVRNGARVLGRMTFTPLEGQKVRQLVEQSLDEGKTWTTQFDGTYIRKSGAPV